MSLRVMIYSARSRARRRRPQARAARDGPL